MSGGYCTLTFNCVLSTDMKVCQVEAGNAANVPLLAPAWCA